jgi:hypothetical protein
VDTLDPEVTLSDDGYVEYVVSPLFADAAYEFVVQAENAVGMSKMTETSHAVSTLPPTLPHRPVRPTIGEITLTHTRCEWSSPHASGAPVYEFHVFALECSDSDDCSLPHDTTSLAGSKPLAMVMAQDAVTAAIELQAQAQLERLEEGGEEVFEEDDMLGDRSSSPAFGDGGSPRSSGSPRGGKSSGAAGSFAPSAIASGAAKSAIVVCEEGCPCTTFVEGLMPGKNYRIGIYIFHWIV